MIISRDQRPSRSPMEIRFPSQRVLSEFQKTQPTLEIKVGVVEGEVVAS